MTTLDELKAEHKRLGERIAALEKPCPLEEGKEVQHYPLNFTPLGGYGGTVQVLPQDWGWDVIIRRRFSHKETAIEKAREICGGRSD